MPTITLGKVKFIHRGAYNASTVYSKGDIVDFDNRMYIFNNDTPKNHAPIFLNTINGTVPSLGIQTNKIRMDFSGFNPVTQKWGLVTSHQRYSGADGTMPVFILRVEKSGHHLLVLWFTVNTLILM